MRFHWPDYLGVARELEQQTMDSEYAEACLRSAISRAYYAALNTACSFLQVEWGTELPKSAEIHRSVPDWFAGADDADDREIGVLLERLRDRRRRADYADEIGNAASLSARSTLDA